MGRKYTELAVIMRQTISQNNTLLLEPFKIVEGYFDQTFSRFVDSEGYTYSHFSELEPGNCFCYHNNIGALMYGNKNITYNDFKKELLKEAKKYKIEIAKENEDISVNFVYPEKLEQPIFDFYEQLSKEIELYLDVEWNKSDDLSDSNNLEEVKEQEENKSELKIECLGKQENIDNEIHEKIKHPEIDVNKLYNNIKKRIIGQDEGVKALLSVMWNNSNTDDIADNILLIGPTGVGKTAILREVAKQIGVPIAFVNTNDYTQNGYVGADVKNILTTLVRSCDGDTALAERGIIVLDEFDKIKGHDNSGGHIVNDIAVQQELLKLVEDGTFDITLGERKVTLNTKNITFVALGAFSKINDDNIKPVGFNNSVDTKIDKNNYNDITTNDIIKYGFIPELIGRFPVLIKLNNLTEKDLYNIILNSKSSTFINRLEILKQKGLNIEYSDDLIKEIARSAHKLGLGGRSLNNIISYIMSDINFEIAVNKGKYKKLVLNKNIVNDNKDYDLS